ncbi:MAG: helix-turn-helix domain-containing protein [Ruminococcaceae bacterium]|nr:helix-turn-helix domain-containing protein [Oscillospiraceae bacterium]
MPNVLTIREAVQRAKAEGLPISEYTLRQWVRTGAIPTRKVGQKALLFYPNLVRYLQCEDGADNTPATRAAASGICRVL